MAQKSDLKKLTSTNKELFELSNNNNYIIEAAITYAIYNALGGKKLIPLPPFTDTIYNIIYHTAIVKLKIGNKITVDIMHRAEKYLSANINNIRAIEMIQESQSKLKLYTKKAVYLIDISGDAALLISRIAFICIMESCKELVNGSIQDVIYSYFSNIGRN